VNDIEICYRQRYLDLIMNKDSQKKFMLKFNLIKELRHFLEYNGYIEVETPVLINKPSGDHAKPFISHHNALDMDVYLTISPETYLKRAIIGGFTKVFEFARCFRNEGIDATHLQDFTMLECYCAYYNYKDNMKFTQEMIKYAVTKVFGSSKIRVDNREVDFSAEWDVLSFRELLLKDCSIDINGFETSDALLNEIKMRGIDLESETDLKILSRGNLIDLLYKKVSRPKMIKPTFLTAHPVSVSPLARSNDDNPTIADRFQLVVNGAEIINGYSELVDPIEQNKRLMEQARLNASGDSEAMMMDKEYVKAMMYGMPPISGWGLGIDRLLQVLTGEGNLRDYVLFPLMRPID
ncbi:MAG: lysine--tRNA ligase, partial [Oscillospiraceae bacterium]|nr:lysine--tRNA ligase [Oscillospiraceae bacterium]